jgi:hypothetical protein
VERRIKLAEARDFALPRVRLDEENRYCAKVKTGRLRSCHKRWAWSGPGNSPPPRAAVFFVGPRFRWGSTLYATSLQRVVTGGARMSKPNRCGLSACIITYNEADRIEACLRSVAFCDEAIVVDSHSTDTTRELAVAIGACVIERD